MRIRILLILLCFGTFAQAQSDFNDYYNRGQEKYEKGDFNNAVGEFSNALNNRKTARNDYQIAKALMARAMCRMNLKNFNGAIADMAEAIKLKPEYSDLYFARSLIHLQNKQYDECVTWANKGLQLKPQYEELILLKGHARFEQKKYEEALTYVDTVLQNINPVSIEAWNMKGENKEHLKDFQGGIDAFSKAIEIDAQNYAAFYDRGICYAHMKNFDAAMVDINKAMAIDTAEKWIGYNNIAFFIKFEQKDYKGATELFDKAIKANPAFAYAYSNRAYARIQLNDLEGARKDITKSLELDDQNSYAYKTYAQLLIAEKKEKQACDKLKKALDLGYTAEYDEDVNDLMKQYCK